MTATLTPPFTIHNIQDTRQYEEQADDRWVAIPGSGDPRECDRCTRIHEIHAEVTDANGQSAVVGVGCMNTTAAETRSMAGKATRAARKAAKEAAQATAKAEMEAHAAAVAAMPFPADRIERTASDWGKDKQEWRLDDARVLVDPWADHEERLGALESSWRRNRMMERVGGSDAYYALSRRAGAYYDFYF